MKLARTNKWKLFTWNLGCSLFHVMTDNTMFSAEGWIHCKFSFAVLQHHLFQKMLFKYSVCEIMSCNYVFADKVIRHNPSLPVYPFTFTYLEPWSNSQHNTKGTLVHSNSSVNQLLFYDIITLPENITHLHNEELWAE